MSEVNICMLHPGFPAVSNTIRHALRDLYGFVPLDLGEDLARYVHTSVGLWQHGLEHAVEANRDTEAS